MTNQPNDADRMRALGDALSLIGSVVGRYRAGLVEGGIPEDQANAMARALNDRLMDGAFETATPPNPTPEDRP